MCSDITSVFGGPADKANYGETEEDFVKMTVSSGIGVDAALDDIYKEIRKFRASENKEESRFKELETEVLKNHSHQWLANIELYELAQQNNFKPDDIAQNLNEIASSAADLDIKTCISKGRELAPIGQTI